MVAIDFDFARLIGASVAIDASVMEALVLHLNVNQRLINVFG